MLPCTHENQNESASGELNSGGFHIDWRLIPPSMPKKTIRPAFSDWNSQTVKVFMRPNKGLSHRPIRDLSSVPLSHSSATVCPLELHGARGPVLTTACEQIQFSGHYPLSISCWTFISLRAEIEHVSKEFHSWLA